MSAVSGIPQTSPRYRFPLTPFDQIAASRNSPYLVRGVLPKEGLCLVWGEPKCGKTFWMLDLAMHVAMDRPYRGRRTKSGPVVYIACEGQEGFMLRLEAYRKAHGLAGCAVPFHLLSCSLNLSGEATTLIRNIREQSVQPSLIVIDTLNRTLKGSESSDDDMAKYIKSSDLLRAAFKCAVVLVHHCGYDKGRPRGHSSLIGAVDAQISVKRDRKNGVIKTEVELLKDGEEGAETFSTLQGVSLGHDSDGEALGSCVIEEIQGSEIRARSEKPLGKAERVALDALRTGLELKGQEPASIASVAFPDGVERVLAVATWREMALEKGISAGKPDAQRMAFNRSMDGLEKRSVICHKDGYVWLPPNK